MRRALTALLLAAPLALSACGDDEPVPTTGAGATTSPLQPGVASEVPSDAQPAQVVALTVADGRVSGDTGPVPVRRGSRVRLTVLSDVPGTLLVEGYDLRETVPAGRPVQLELVADVAGEHSVSLDGTALTTLDVA